MSMVSISDFYVFIRVCVSGAEKRVLKDGDQVESGQEVHGGDVVEEAAIGIDGDHLAVLQIPR